MNLLAMPVLRPVFVPALLYACLALPASAQIPPSRDPDISRLVQELFPVMSEEANPEELFEFFFQLLTDPVDINRATKEQLAAILLLNDSQIQAFIAYRNLAGRFLSLYELQAIPGWDLATIQNIAPFLTLESSPESLEKAFQNPTQHFFVTRMRRIREEQKGFSPVDPGSRSVTRYAGGPWNWYARYRYARTGAFSIGATLEKDAGEVWNWAPARQAYGIDFTSFHIQLLNRGKLKNLVAGDFQVQAGQGLVLASGFSLGKGAEVIRTTHRSATGIRPYTSVTEQGFFRGMAATYRLAESWDLTLFHSHKRRDGTIAEKGAYFDSEVITSFPTDGYHRTPTERRKHGNILEKNVGGHLYLNRESTSLKAGITWLYTNYSLPVEKRDLPYNRYDFRGRHNLIAGFHVSYRLKNTHFFSESARSAGGGTGKVAGAVTALNKQWDVTVLFRDYQRNFHTFYGNAFREGARPFNEKGIYSGIRYSPDKKWQYSAYVDFFRFPWKRYLVDTLSGGHEFLLHTSWRPVKSFKAYGVVKSGQKQRNNRGNEVGPLPLATVRRSTAILNLEWKKPIRWSFRTRLQGGIYRFGNEAPSTGFAIAQDATLELKKVALSGRMALFRTDDYDSRQYVFEKDVLYSFSIPAYYNHGLRHYVMIRYDIARPVRVWVRWSRTRYSNVETIGSGLDEITGNTRNEVKFQVMYRF